MSRQLINTCCSWSIFMVFRQYTRLWTAPKHLNYYSDFCQRLSLFQFVKFYRQSIFSSQACRVYMPVTSLVTLTTSGYLAKNFNPFAQVLRYLVDRNLNQAFWWKQRDSGSKCIIVQT